MPEVTAMQASGTAPDRQRSRTARILVGFAGLLVFVTLMALGTWQIHRLSWKLDLIARVDARIHAAATAAPGPAAWPDVSEADQYRRVTARGMFDNSRETLVQAVTEIGAGFWVLTPLRDDRGFTVLVNRGFVPSDLREPAARPAGEVSGETRVTGLLRTTEPGGAFLRSNDPADHRWYSRDVAAIAAARGLGPVAPYFIDADASPNPGGFPVGGLTVVSFPNNHLVYALTWYGLAALLAGAALWMTREGRRRDAALRGSAAGETATLAERAAVERMRP